MQPLVLGALGLLALGKAVYQETSDILKLETLDGSQLDILQGVERVRRVTWRMGLIGAALMMLLLHLMKVEISSPFSVGVVGWIFITSCMNFRAYHVEDIGTLKLRKSIRPETTEGLPEAESSVMQAK
jgi:hypothetical protein